jgi:hypothetical protein
MMMRAYGCLAAVLVACCWTVNACDACGCDGKGKKETLTGVVKVVMDGDKVKELSLTVLCKSDCTGCDKDCKYAVKDFEDGKVVKLDGKTVELTGHVNAEKKIIKAEKVVEKKAKE